MSTAFDDRIVRVGIQIGNEQFFYDGLDIYASGEKFASSLKNQCQVRINNLNKSERDYILKSASPIQRADIKPIFLTLDVGRLSYGTFRLYEGDVFQGGVTQPPDIGITLYSVTNNFAQAVLSDVSFDGKVDLRIIAQKVAELNGLVLDYQAGERFIRNYSFTGSPDRQIEKLNLMGGVISFVDNKTLVVLSNEVPRGNVTRLINAQTGMIGVPQANPAGVTVQVMLDNTIQVGQKVTIKSDINPGADGNYYVKTMNFELANRQDPFFFNLFCQNEAYFLGQG